MQENNPKFEKYCQSCAMPMKKGKNSGTNKDGSKNVMYCKHCYSNGQFIEPNITCVEMQTKVSKIMKEKMPVINFFFGKMFIKKIPNLKRWSKN